MTRHFTIDDQWAGRLAQAVKLSDNLRLPKKPKQALKDMNAELERLAKREIVA